MKRLSIAASTLALLTAFGASADAPSPMRADTPLTAIKAGQPMRMVYELEASAWAFVVPVTGKARFDIKLMPENYLIESELKTTGLIGIFVDYDMRQAAQGYLTEEGLKSYSYYAKNYASKKSRKVEMVWGSDDVDMTATPAFGNLGDPPATPAQKMRTNDPITELISFGLEPRAPGGNPCGDSMEMFDGRQLSRLNFEYIGMKKVKSKAWKGQAIECHVTLDKVAGYKDGSEEDKETLSGIDGPIRMWLAPLPNGGTVPIRIEAKPADGPLGKVTLQARKLRFEPIE